MDHVNPASARAQAQAADHHETYTGERLHIAWKADGALVMRCSACESAYTAPEGNFACPLCGSDLTFRSDEEPGSFAVREDITESILWSYLTSRAAMVA